MNGLRQGDKNGLEVGWRNQATAGQGTKDRINILEQQDTQRLLGQEQLAGIEQRLDVAGGTAAARTAGFQVGKIDPHTPGFGFG